MLQTNLNKGSVTATFGLVEVGVGIGVVFSGLITTVNKKSSLNRAPHRREAPPISTST